MLTRQAIQTRIEKLDRGDLEVFVMTLFDHCYWDEDNECYDEDKECPGTDAGRRLA